MMNSSAYICIYVCVCACTDIRIIEKGGYQPERWKHREDSKERSWEMLEGRKRGNLMNSISNKIQFKVIIILNIWGYSLCRGKVYIHVCIYILVYSVTDLVENENA